MTDLRRWLAKANAFAVLYTALAALLLQIGWLVWREYRRAPADVSPASAPPSLSREDSLGLRAFFDRAAMAAPLKGNPFLNPRPPRNIVRLTYHGMYESSSAVPKALIEDSKSRRRLFYGIGEVLFGMRVESIDMPEVRLQPRDGDPVTLKLREPYEFEERPLGY